MTKGMSESGASGAPCPARLCEPRDTCPHHSLPFPVGTVLRCTRWTEWGTETVYGRVIYWHHEQGWEVESPHGGLAAGPGPSAFIDFSAPSGIRVESEEWRFEPVHPVIASKRAR